MPPRDNPTARQVRLGVELRKLRERAGKTAQEAAGLIATDRTKISHMEAGRVGIGEERIRRLATFYECDDQALIDSLCDISREYRGQFWWDEYRRILAPGFLDIAELEYHATRLGSIQIVTVPGLLQTEEYARTLFNGRIPQLPADELDARVEFRMRRQDILERERPTPFAAVIHEAALRMGFGGRTVARAQLNHLVTASHRESLTIRVIPFATEDFIESTQPILYASGGVPQLDTAQIDGPLGSNLLDDENSLAKYRMLFDAAEKSSLGERESRDLVHRITKEV